jgi:hypothetical protein
MTSVCQGNSSHLVGSSLCTPLTGGKRIQNAPATGLSFLSLCLAQTTQKSKIQSEQTKCLFVLPLVWIIQSWLWLLSLPNAISQCQLWIPKYTDVYTEMSILMCTWDAHICFSRQTFTIMFSFEQLNSSWCGVPTCFRSLPYLINRFQRLWVEILDLPPWVPLEPRALSLLGQPSTTEPHPQMWIWSQGSTWWPSLAWTREQIDGC